MFRSLTCRWLFFKNDKTVRESVMGVEDGVVEWSGWDVVDGMEDVALVKKLKKVHARSRLGYVLKVAFSSDILHKDFVKIVHGLKHDLVEILRDTRSDKGHVDCCVFGLLFTADSVAILSMRYDDGKFKLSVPGIWVPPLWANRDDRTCFPTHILFFSSFADSETHIFISS